MEVDSRLLTFPCGLMFSHCSFYSDFVISVFLLFEELFDWYMLFEVNDFRNGNGVLCVIEFEIDIEN